MDKHESTPESKPPESKLGESETAFRLDGYLKYVGVVGTGGEAKIRIQAGEVQVNGELETRRRKQLVLGDRVEIGGETFVVEAPEEPF